jgi:uncharacterized protein (TIGR00251 family)
LSKQRIREVKGGVVFGVKVVPGSSRTGLCGILDGMVKIKVAAPAEKGKANRCLVEFLANKLGLKKSAVKIIAGQTKSVKQVQISGRPDQAGKAGAHFGHVGRRTGKKIGSQK